jgi:thiamine-phosphate pyrophosphorylase
MQGWLMHVDIRLYVIVDPSVAGDHDLATLAAQAAAGGATLIQYRDKSADTGLMVAKARRIHAALSGSGVPLLINDRVDIALAAGAEGVHLGQSDMSPMDARRLLGPTTIIGRTIKNDKHAAALSDEPVDYACIGGVFATQSKQNDAEPVGLAGLSRLREQIRKIAPTLPAGAIAGINVQNAASVIAAGADGIAIISAVIAQADPRKAAENLRHVIDKAFKNDQTLAARQS